MLAVVTSARAIPGTGAGHSGLPDPATEGRLRPSRFADRAIEVLPLAAASRAGRDIAVAPFISAATAGGYVPDVLAEVNAAGRTTAIVIARRAGLSAEGSRALGPGNT
jgi:DNA-binding NarL/FixJ family response regulator